MGFLNFFKRTSTWTNGEFVVIKICLVSVGIFIGIRLYEWLSNFEYLFISIYIFSALAILFFWLRRLKKLK